MRYIASGRLPPEMGISTSSSTCKETTIGGEGHLCGLAAAYKIQKKLGILGVPYQNCLLKDEGKLGASRKE
jgi:hypothetical protein